MKNNYKYLLSCVSGVALLFVQTQIALASNQHDVEIKAIPKTSCIIQSIEHAAFGNLNTLDGLDKIANASISVQCSKASTYSIAAGPGGHAGDSNTDDRYMKTSDGAHSIRYFMYEGLPNTVEGNDVWKVNDDPLEGVSNGSGDVQKYEFYTKIKFTDINLPAAGYNENFSDNVELTVKIN